MLHGLGNEFSVRTGNTIGNAPSHTAANVSRQISLTNPASSAPTVPGSPCNANSSSFGPDDTAFLNQLFVLGLQYANSQKPTLSPANTSEHTNFLTQWALGKGTIPPHVNPVVPRQFVYGNAVPLPPNMPNVGIELVPNRTVLLQYSGSSSAAPAPAPDPSAAIPSALQLAAGAYAFRGRNANVGTNPIVPMSGSGTAYMSPQDTRGTGENFTIHVMATNATEQESVSLVFSLWRVPLCAPAAAKTMGINPAQSNMWVFSGGYIDPGSGKWIALARTGGKQVDVSSSNTIPMAMVYPNVRVAAAGEQIPVPAAARREGDEHDQDPASVVVRASFSVYTNGYVELELETQSGFTVFMHLVAKGGAADSSGTVQIQSPTGCSPCYLGTGTVSYSQPFLCVVRAYVANRITNAVYWNMNTSDDETTVGASADAESEWVTTSGWLTHEWHGPLLELAAIPQSWVDQAGATLLALGHPPRTIRFLRLVGYSTTTGIAHCALALLPDGQNDATARGGDRLPCTYWSIQQDGIVTTYAEQTTPGKRPADDEPFIEILQMNPSLTDVPQSGVAFPRAVRCVVSQAGVNIMWVSAIDAVANVSAESGAFERPDGVLNLSCPSLLYDLPPAFRSLSKGVVLSTSGGRFTNDGSVLTGSGLMQCNAWGTSEQLTRAAMRTAGMDMASGEAVLLPNTLSFGQAAGAFFSLTLLGFLVVAIVVLVLYGIVATGLAIAKRAAKPV